MNNGKENCWDFWDCKSECKEKCIAYTTNSGKKCWCVGNQYFPKGERPFLYCYGCVWYRKLNTSLAETE